MTDIEYEDNSIASIIANITFSKTFYSKEECETLYNIIKPGGHLLLFTKTSTQDLMGIFARHAGFEVRDTIHTPQYNANIILCRKPLSESTVANNVLKWGTGGLNIDASRIGSEGGTKGIGIDLSCRVGDPKTGFRKNSKLEKLNTGRFPANIILDTKTANIMDEQSGERKGMVTQNSSPINMYGGNALNKSSTTLPPVREGYNDTGGASRFFYVADNMEDLLNYLETLTTPSNEKCLKLL